MERKVLCRVVSLVLILIFAITAIGLAGCGNRQASPETSNTVQAAQKDQAAQNTRLAALETAAEPVMLSVGLLAEDLDFFQVKVKEESFIKALPNVTIDFQQYKNTEDMIKNQKIRQAANEMPDVIYMKPDHILELKSSLLPWSEEEELVKQNKFVNTLAVNAAVGGGYYGLPMKAFSEWVYYKKSIFKELNLQIPKTWDEFVNTARAVKASGKYIPLAMGAKDIWPCYPFNEFMPLIVGNNPDLLSDIARQDEPFGAGSAFDTAYSMADQLFKADVMGKPLSTNWPESEQLMAFNKAAMLAAGQYFLLDYKKFGGDMNDIAVFPLPVTNDRNETIKAVGMIDLFYGISKKCKNQDTAKKYVAWFFSPEIYKNYITERMMTSAIKGVDAGNIFAEALMTRQMEIFMYVPGDEDYTKMIGETRWETKTIGTMMMAGQDYKDILADYNNKWKAARAKLGIK